MWNVLEAVCKGGRAGSPVAAEAGWTFSVRKLQLLGKEGAPQQVMARGGAGGALPRLEGMGALGNEVLVSASHCQMSLMVPYTSHQFWELRLTGCL